MGLKWDYKEKSEKKHSVKHFSALSPTSSVALNTLGFKPT
jgi:hypothetical protein